VWQFVAQCAGVILEKTAKLLGQKKQSAQRKPKEALHSSAKPLMANNAPQFALQNPYIHRLDWSSRFYLDYCEF
jgi:hypothetical protein